MTAEELEEPDPPLIPLGTIVLEAEHLSGPPFDPQRHAGAVEADVTERLRNWTLHLPGGTSIRIETSHEPTDIPTHGLEAHP